MEYDFLAINNDNMNVNDKDSRQQWKENVIRQLFNGMKMPTFFVNRPYQFKTCKLKQMGFWKPVPELNSVRKYLILARVRTSKGLYKSHQVKKFASPFTNS